MTKKTDTPAIRFKGFSDTWEQRKLGELGTITTGNTPSTSIPDYYSDDGIVWVTPTDICENITFESARKLSDLGQQVGRVVPKNTILVTCIASIGKNTMLGNTGSFNQQINGLTPNENKYDPYFLLTESALWSAKMKGSAASGTMQIVNRTEFSELKTWLPSLIEQQAIGAFFKQLDNLITLHQRKYEKLHNIKKSMLEKMFPKNGSNVPEIRFKGFTEAWEQRKLGEVMNVTSVKRIHQSDWTDYGIRFLRARDIVSAYKNEEPDDYLYISKEKYDEYSSISGKVSIGDMLVTGVGTIGVPYLVENSEPLYFKDGNIIWFQNEDKVFGKFLFYSFAGKSIQDFITESAGIGTVGTYTIESGKKTPISLPNKEEQERIGLFFANLDHLITLHQRELEKLQNIKKSMLEKMFV